MTTLNFNAQTVAPSTGQLDAMPKGWYIALIESSETKPTSKGDGSYLELKFKIVQGRYQNRVVFARLNLNNPNPIASEIAYKDLSAICHATGILSVQDSSQLHNIPMKIRLKIRKGGDDYDDNNEISAFKNVNEQVKLADDEAPAPGVGGAGMPQQMPQQQMPPQQMPPQQQYQQPPQQQMPQQYQQPPVQQQQMPPQQQMQQPPQQQPQYQQAQQPWQQPDPQQQQYQQQPPQQQYQQPPQQPPMDQPPQMQQQYQQPPVQQQMQQQPPQQQMQQPPVQQQQQQQPPVQQQQSQPYNGAQMNPQAAIPPWQQQPQ